MLQTSPSFRVEERFRKWPAPSKRPGFSAPDGPKITEFHVSSNCVLGLRMELSGSVTTQPRKGLNQVIFGDFMRSKRAHDPSGIHGDKRSETYGTSCISEPMTITVFVNARYAQVRCPC